MKKHRKWSIFEAVTNTTVGFAMAIIIQWVFYPLLGIEGSLKMMTKMSLIFVVASIIKNYFLRELFRKTKKKWKSQKKLRKNTKLYPTN